MEEILKDILHELKGIRYELNKGNDIPLKVTIGDNVIVEKVIKEINKQARLNGNATIVV